MSAEAIRKNAGGVVKFTAGTTYSSGEIIQLPDGRAAVIAGLKPVASGDAVGAETEGEFDVLSASGTTFAAGAPVYWDASASLAITAPGAVDDLLLGVATVAKVSGQTRVSVDFNRGFGGAGSSVQRAAWMTRAVVLDHADTTEHVLVAANENPNGLLVAFFGGVVTEEPAGSSEDQLELTLYDEDDNVLSVAITTNTTPDAVGDIIVGTRTLASATTGLVASVIPAGKAAYAKVSQATAGTPAGAVRVSALVAPLL